MGPHKPRAVYKKGAYFCRICTKNIPVSGNPKENKNWKSHINGKAHMLKLPEFCSISNLPANPIIEHYQSYCEVFGPIEQFNHDAIKNIITVNFKNIIHLTTFLQHDNHVIDGHQVGVFWITKSPVPKKKKAKKNAEIAKDMLMAEPAFPFKQKTIIAKGTNNRKHKLIAGLKINPKKYCVPYDILQKEKEYEEAIIEKMKRQTQFHNGVNTLLQMLQNEQNESVGSQATITNDLKRILPSNVGVLIYGSRCTNLNVYSSDFNFHLSSYQTSDEDNQDAIVRLEKALLESGLFEGIASDIYRHATILKCVHQPTRGKCALTVGSLELVISSQLLHDYFQIEKKVLGLGLFIKFWFTIRNYYAMGATELSPYTLSLLIIFYLQQPPFNFPTVRDLQKDAKLNLINGHNFGYKRISFNTKAFAPASIESLFLGFIHFYLDFDFIHYDVSVFTGVPMLKTKYFDEPSLNYVPEMLLSVQDPLMRTFCTTQCGATSFGKLQRALSEVLKSASSETPIYDILTNNGEKFFSTYQIYQIKPKSDFCTGIFISNWFEKVRSLFSKICTNVLHGKVTEMPASAVPYQDIALDGAEVLHYKVEMYSIFFKDRMNFFKLLWEKFKAEKTKVVDQDVQVTKKIIELLLQKFPFRKFDVQLTITLTLKKIPVECSVIVGFKSPKMIGSTLYNFFRFKLPEWFAELEENDSALGEFKKLDEKRAEELSRHSSKEKTAIESRKKVEHSHLHNKRSEERQIITELSKRNENSRSVREKRDRSWESENRHENRNTNSRRDSRSNDKYESVRENCDRSRDSEKRNEKRNKNSRRDSRSSDKYESVREKRDRSRDSEKRNEKRNKTSRRDSRSSDKYESVREKRDRSWDSEKGNEKRTKRNDFKEYHESILNDVRKMLNNVQQPPGNAFMGPTDSYGQPITAQPTSQQWNGGGMLSSCSYTQPITMQPSIQHDTQPITRQPPIQQWNSGGMQPSCSYTQPISMQPAIQQWNGGGIQCMQPVQQIMNPMAPSHYTHGSSSYLMQQEVRHSNAIVQNSYQHAILTPQIKQVETAVSTKRVETVVSTKQAFTSTSFGVKEKEINKVPFEKSQHAGQLFADKRISLSDFLTIAAKPEVPSINTEQVQKKIKVISRVQEIIKTLSDQSNFQFGFVVQPTSANSQPSTETISNVSPLHRRPNIRFRCTSTPDSNKEPYESAILTILESNGIIQKSLRFEPNVNDKNNTKCDAQTQTMNSGDECQNCSNKKHCTYATIATQITEGDFNNLPKEREYKSLVHMTPAQLLAFRPPGQLQQMYRPQMQPNQRTNGLQPAPRAYPPNKYWY